MKEQDNANSKSNIISIETARKRIQPPSDLTADELKIFSDIVRGTTSHFVEGDKPLLTAYCAAVHLLRLYTEHSDNNVARTMRLRMAMLVSILANRLRLAQQ